VSSSNCGIGIAEGSKRSTWLVAPNSIDRQKIGRK
jgi:hypothetical protein